MLDFNLTEKQKSISVCSLIIDKYKDPWDKQHHQQACDKSTRHLLILLRYIYAKTVHMFSQFCISKA